jgi:hypothetical protein
VTYATGLIRIVGTPEVCAIAERLVARVKLDRSLVYHPDPRLDIPHNRSHIMELALAAHIPELPHELIRAFNSEDPQGWAQQTFGTPRLRLDSLWKTFEEATGEVIGSRLGAEKALIDEKHA